VLNIEQLKKNVSGIDFRLKRPGIYKVLVPFFHEDGDMYDIFLEESPVNPNLLRISDHGLTIMKLSYCFDFNTDNKKDVLNSIILQNRAKIENGEIYIEATPDIFQQCLYQLLQTLTKVSNVDILSRETIKSMFYDLLKEFVGVSFSAYEITEKYTPIANDENLMVDYRINARKPIFLYGVKDDSKASKVIINCLNYQKNDIPFRSLVVHEDLDGLTSFNKKQLINVSDKQFCTLEDFKAYGLAYIQRELSAA